LATEIFSFENLIEAEKELNKIDANPVGVKIMALKAVFKAVKITDVDTGTANMLKLEMVSRGGDVAISGDAGRFDAERTDIIVLGTLAQHVRLIRKLQYHKFGECRKVAETLQKTLFADQEITKLPGGRRRVSTILLNYYGKKAVY
jgi:dihydropteroate synthase